MKTHVLLFSTHFPSHHPKAGEETNFDTMVPDLEKIHTIRGNYDYWKPKLDEVNRGEAILSCRIWTGKPYRSPQKEICQFTKVDYEAITMGNFVASVGLNNVHVDLKVLAENDGLLRTDFVDWFGGADKFAKENFFTGIIIHFTDHIYDDEIPQVIEKPGGGHFHVDIPS